MAGRLGHTRYTLRQPTRGAAGGQWWNSNRANQATSANTVRLRGRHLLDHDALTCLLVLLFVDEPKLNTSRLHRVLRNLCYHAQTRTWVIRALLSILQRSSTENKAILDNEDKLVSKSSSKSKQKSFTPQPQTSDSTSSQGKGVVDNKGSQASWLSISLDAALGCRANVFQMHKGGKKHNSPSNTCVTIHPQASPLICRHVLDTLISLAKSFPCHFLPQNKAKEGNKCDASDKDSKDCENKAKVKESESRTSVASSNHSSPAKATAVSKVDKSESRTDATSSTSNNKLETDFWDLLVKLDSTSGSRKGKSMQRIHSSGSVDSDTVYNSFDTSPLGQLMMMLAHPVVRRSQMLTDRLLRLLGLVSVGLPEFTNRSSAARTLTTTTSRTISTGKPLSTVAPNQVGNVLLVVNQELEQ